MNNELNKDEKAKISMRVSITTIICNFALTVFKLIAGIVANSGAMISDAIHSASDVLSTFVVIAGVLLSRKESDDDHPYGHDRMECVAAIILSIMLAITGAGIGWTGAEKIISGNYGDLAVPGVLALVAAIVSIAVKEGMYWYTRAAAKKINSGALMADAWHHRSDSLSSIGALIGVFFARIGFPIMDPIASIVICLFIFKVAIEIFKDALDKMVDKACPEEKVKKIEKVITSQDGVKGIDEIKTRMFGNKVYVDVEIMVNGSLNLTHAHEIAEKVHDAVEAKFPEVKHCMVHVNPMTK